MKNVYIELFRLLLCSLIVLFHMEGGWLGETSVVGGVSVDGFLVLSGFLHGIPSEKRFNNIWKIYVHKCIRILPLLFISIVFAILLHLDHFFQNIKGYGLLYYFFHPGRFMSLMESYNVVLWFMVPYVIFIFITPLYLRFNAWGKFIFLSLVVTLPVYYYSSYSADYRNLSYNTLCIAWQYWLGLIIGEYFYKFASKIPLIFAYFMFFILIVSGFIPAEKFLWAHELPLGNVILSLFFGLGLLSLYGRKNLLPHLLNKTILASAGLTYTIFLLHCPMLHLGFNHLLTLYFTIMAAILLKWFVERPLSYLYIN